jgi:hypothetical protein
MSEIAHIPADWFLDSELERCPKCGERLLAPASPGLSAVGMRVCLDCGVVPDDEAGQ